MKELLHLDEPEEKLEGADDWAEATVSSSSQTLGEVLLAPLLVSPDLDPVPLLLGALVGKLGALMASAPVLVPLDIFLPAPPLYCPPQSIGYEAGDVPAKESEEGLRLNVTLILERVRCLLQGAHLGVPLIAWYLHFLRKLWEAMGQDLQSSSSFKGLWELCRSCSDLSAEEDPSRTPREWSLPEGDQQGALQCLQSLRVLCGLLWCLTCRDHLALAFRELQQFTLTTSLISGRKDPYSTQHLHVCYQVLHYICFMLPFQKFLSSRDSLALMFLNVALEIPPTKELAKLVAQLMTYFEKPSMNVERRHSELIQKWKTQECDIFSDAWTSKSKVKLAKPKPLLNGKNTRITESLDFPNASTWDAVYECCYEEQRAILALQSQKYVAFLTGFSKAGIMCEDYIACSFELEVFFVEYLSPFFQIGVLKNEALEPAPPQVPLLRAYQNVLREMHLSNFYDSVKYLQKQENLETTRVSFLDLAASCDKLQAETFRFSASSKRKSVLFRHKNRIFCSPSKKAVYKFEKFVFHVQKHKSKRNKTSTAKRRWKSLSNMFSAQDRFRMLAKNSSKLNLSLSPVKFQPRAKSAQDVSSLAAVLRTNGAENFVNSYAWLHLWLVNSGSELICKPSTFFLAFSRVIYEDHPENMVKILETSGTDKSKRTSTKLPKGKPELLRKNSAKKKVTFSPEHVERSENCLNGTNGGNLKEIESDLSINNKPSISNYERVKESENENSSRQLKPIKVVEDHPVHTGHLVSDCNNDTSPQEETSKCSANPSSVRIPECSNDISISKVKAPSPCVSENSEKKDLFLKPNRPPASPPAFNEKVVSVLPIQPNVKSVSDQHCDPDNKIGNILKTLKKSVEFITYASSDFSSSNSQISSQRCEFLAPVEIPKRRASHTGKFSFDSGTLPASPVVTRRIVTRKYSLPPLYTNDCQQISSNSSDSSEIKIHPEEPAPESDDRVLRAVNLVHSGSVTDLSETKNDINSHISEQNRLPNISRKLQDSSSSKSSGSFLLKKKDAASSPNSTSLPSLPGFTTGTNLLSNESPVSFCSQMEGSCKDSTPSRSVTIPNRNDSLTALVQNILYDQLPGIVEKLSSRPSSSSNLTPQRKEIFNKPNLATSSTQTPEHDFKTSPSRYSVYNASVLNQTPISEKNLAGHRNSVLDEIPLLNLNPNIPFRTSSDIRFTKFPTHKDTKATESYRKLPLLQIKMPVKCDDQSFTILSPEKIAALFKKCKVSYQDPELDEKESVPLRNQKHGNSSSPPVRLLKLVTPEEELVRSNDRKNKLIEGRELLRDILDNFPEDDCLQAASTKDIELKSSFCQTETFEPDLTHLESRVPVISEEQCYADLQYRVYNRLLEKEKASCGSQTVDKEGIDAQTSIENDFPQEPAEIMPSKMQPTSSEEVQAKEKECLVRNESSKNEQLEKHPVSDSITKIKHSTAGTQTVSLSDIESNKIDCSIFNESHKDAKNDTLLEENRLPDARDQKNKTVEIPWNEESGLDSSIKLGTDVGKTVGNSMSVSEIKDMLAYRKPLQNRTNLKRDLCERLNTMQKQLDVIETISTNVEKDFSSTQQVLKNLEYSNSKKGNSLEKNINFSVTAAMESGPSSLSDIGHSSWVAKLPIELQSSSKSNCMNPKSSVGLPDTVLESLLNETQTLQPGRRRISFGPTETILVPKIDEFEKTFRIVPFLKEDLEPNEIGKKNLEEATLKEMYKIYGSKRLPSKVLENLQSKQMIQSEELTSERSHGSDESSDSLSSWEVPEEVERILYGESSTRGALV